MLKTFEEPHTVVRKPNAYVPFRRHYLDNGPRQPMRQVTVPTQQERVPVPVQPIPECGNVSETVRTRSGRESRKPTYLNDYV